MTNKNIIYVQSDLDGKISNCPYVFTKSETIINIASMFGQGDVGLHMGKGEVMCYQLDSEWYPFIELLNRTAIEYEIKLKLYDFFDDLENGREVLLE